MNGELKFSGWAAAKRIPWQDVFTEQYNDDGELLLVSKKAYSHDDPDMKPFTYRYVVDALDLMRRTGDPCQAAVHIQLCLVPEPAYWSGEALESMAGLYGYEDKEEDELREGFQVTDAIGNGLAAEMGSDTVAYDQKEYDEGFYDVLDCDGVPGMLDAAASVLEMLDGTRGFALDREWNALGSTGWDTLEYALGGLDPIQKGIEKLKKTM